MKEQTFPFFVFIEFPHAVVKGILYLCFLEPFDCYNSFICKSWDYSCFGNYSSQEMRIRKKFLGRTSLLLLTIVTFYLNKFPLK